MKKIFIGLLSMILAFNSLVCMAAIDSKEVFSIIEQSGKIDMTSIDKDNCIFVVDMPDYTYFARGEPTATNSIMYFFAPVIDSEDVYFSEIRSGKLGDINLWPDTIDHKLLFRLDKYNVDEAKSYAAQNGLSEPDEISVMYCEAYLYLSSYIVECDGVTYIIPFAYTENDNWNPAEDENWDVEIGKAYIYKEFGEKWGKYAELQKELNRLKQEEKENDRTVIYADDGEERYILNGKEVSYEEYYAAMEEKKNNEELKADENKKEDIKEDIKEEAKKDEETKLPEKDNEETKKEDSEQEVVNDDKEAVVETNFDKLRKWGVMIGDETGNLNLEKDVTRAEMAQFIVNMLGLKNVSATSAQSFGDVDSSHWAYNAVQLCSELGIVHGNGDGTFAPDNQVRNTEVIKMLVSTIGYSSLAENNGGFPTGFDKVAREIGLYEGFKFTNIEYAARQDVADLVYKALHTPIMVQVGFGTNPEYTIMDGKDGREYRIMADELIEISE